MEENKISKVKVYGYWGNTNTATVRNALKLKGLAYEYVEEDMDNLSQTVLELNPALKTIPVLVVEGRPIVEPLCIFEFVDDMWENREPSLLPDDPNQKSRVRFWAQFFYQKIVPASYAVVGSEGEALKNASKEFVEQISVLEEGIAKDLWKRGPFTNGDKPGLLDVILGSCYTGLIVLGQLSGVDFLEGDRIPTLLTIMANFEKLEATKETAVPVAKRRERILWLREKALASRKL